MYSAFTLSASKTGFLHAQHSFPGDDLIFLLLLMCSSPNKSATYAMNSNETAIARGRRTNHPHVLSENEFSNMDLHVGWMSGGVRRDAKDL